MPGQAVDVHRAGASRAPARRAAPRASAPRRATAERTPVGRVLDGHAVRGRHAEQPGRGPVGLGVRLAVRDLVAGHHRGEGPVGQRGDTASASDRHDMVTSAWAPLRRAARRAARGHRAATARARAPAATTRSSSSSTIRSGDQVIGEWSRMKAADDHQVVADELVGELVAPGATVLGDDRVLRGDPVGLGVDEGAVHVPEDRCGEAHGSQA